ncbi:hypothetical protein GLOIN_2v1783702 [Rhizophagus clarus]|uniref:Uncharacterized protein n=1 Tax=Rhizophagus clarus TaxID=94130 RepID=A0A8H3LQF1_9GLOM|nr:hypothetical protein GLOIN_2v1783702 [Rhizophagus clarus]
MARDILIDQIKRATRQICRKENNLHQDLACEQRRRYDAEAERDNKIIRKQLAKGGMDTVVGNLENERNEKRCWYFSYRDKNRHNNPPNIQQIGMVGYRPPIFYGCPGEDPEDFLRDLQRYVVASRINVAPGAGQAPGRAEALGKNWRCNNLSDNLGVADLNAVRGIGAGNNANQIGGVATGADIIPNGTWDEDWSIAGGKPVDNAPVALNTGGSLPAVTIAPDIKLG